MILNKKEKCWNDSSLTEERHPGRNDDSLLGELQLELHVYSVSISCLLIKCCYAIYMYICSSNIDNSIILSCIYADLNEFICRLNKHGRSRGKGRLWQRRYGEMEHHPQGTHLRMLLIGLLMQVCAPKLI